MSVEIPFRELRMATYDRIYAACQAGWGFDHCPEINCDFWKGVIPTSPESIVETRDDSEFYGCFNIHMPDGYFYGHVENGHFYGADLWVIMREKNWEINADSWMEFVEKFSQGPPNMTPEQWSKFCDWLTVGEFTKSREKMGT